jgi:hypothetical protein
VLSVGKAIAIILRFVLPWNSFHKYFATWICEHFSKRRGNIIPWNDPRLQVVSRETIWRAYNIDIGRDLIPTVSITKSNLATMLSRVEIHVGGIAKREGMHGKKKKQHRYKSQFETLDAEMLRLKSPVGWYLRKLVTRQPMGRPSGDAKSHRGCLGRWGVFRKCTFCYSLGNRFYLHLSSNVGP